MTPEEIVVLLLAHYRQPEFTTYLEQLRPQLSLAVIELFKRRVDEEIYRRPRRAIQIAEVANVVASYVGTLEAQGLADWAKGNALCHANRDQEALLYYQKAEAVYATLSRPLETARLQVNQTAVLQEIGDFQTALALDQKARPVLEALRPASLRPLGILDMNMGAAYQQMGQLAEALMVYKHGRAIFEELDDPVEAARMDINRANVLEEMDDFQEAEHLLVQARDQLTADGEVTEAAKAELNLGRLAYRRGEYLAGLHHLETAHQFLLADPDPVESAFGDLYRSAIYLELNLLRETLTLAASAEVVFRRERLNWPQTRAMLNQARGYYRLGQYDLAEKWLAQARRRLRQQGSFSRLPELDLERSRLALAAGRVKNALRLARRAEKELPAGAWPAMTAQLHLLRAQCALMAHPPHLLAARRQAEAALSIAADRRLPEQLFTAYALLGQVAEHSGDLAEAWQAYQTAIMTIEIWRRSLPLDELHLSFMEDKLPVYADAVRLSMAIGEPTQTFYLVNLGCSAPLPRLAQPETSGDIGERLRVLQTEWRWYQNKLNQGHDLVQVERPPEQSSQQEENLRWHLDRLEAEIAQLTPRAASGAVPTSTPMLVELETATHFLSDLQRRLPAQTALLQYYIIAGQIHAILVTGTALHLVANISPAESVLRALKAWRFQVEHVSLQSETGSPPPHLSRFYQALIAPLEPHLRGQERLWVVIPPGWHDLPLAAFFDGRRYLVERFELAYLSAPEVLFRTEVTTPVAVAEKIAAVLGCSDEGRLPHTLLEAQEVATVLHPNWRASLYLEEVATFENFRQACQTGHLIHLATHAVFRQDNPLFSWLRLADGPVSVANLMEITLPQHPLVVLSACETGQGESRGGGLMGMGRGFLAAGAAGLVVSLWKVADRAASELMTNFYHSLDLTPGTLTRSSSKTVLPSVSAATALRSAQQQAIARGRPPYYWAAFVFIQG